jgi:hypothetical protein
MSILRKNSGANGFTKLPNPRRREIDKDAGACDREVGENLNLDVRLITPTEPPHRPWLVPGTGRL